MAQLELELVDGAYQGVILGERFEFPANPENKYCVIQFLRAFKKPSGKQGIFSQEQIARTIPDFDGMTRQGVDDHEQRFRASGGNLRHYLTRQRKVDATVVEAVTEVVRQHPLASAPQVCQQVSTRLNRTDLSPANIRTALEEVPCTVIRPALPHQWETGTFHPKEEVILEDALAALLSSPAPPLISEEMQQTGVTPTESGDEMAVQRQQADAVSVLLNPQATVEQVPSKIRLMVFAMTLSFWNVPFSRIGLWLGVSKSTIWNWVTGLAVALYPTIHGWIVAGVTATTVALDEKWLKIRQAWHSWFVGVDEATGRPVVMALLPTRTKWACCWVALSLKRLGLIPKAIITDGLSGYFASLSTVFPRITHLTCLFHHQQGITRWLRAHASHLSEQARATLKKTMKQVVQTCDPRTVRRRLARLAENADAQTCGIATWIKTTTAKLPHLLPALRRNAFPRTTNSIERFFRAFQRFYKTRTGFHSVSSAIKETMVFVVVYVFTIQPGTGTAPIEQIVPEANKMPFYQILNDPFMYGLANICQVNPEGTDVLATEYDVPELKQA